LRDPLLEQIQVKDFLIDSTNNMSKGSKRRHKDVWDRSLNFFKCLITDYFFNYL